jgi:hypothetical protein
MLTLLVLFIGVMYGDSLKGSKWLYAENKNSEHFISTQNLTLRNNGTFKVYLIEADFSCYFSGLYQNHNDTIILDKEVIDKTNLALTTKYYLHDSLLIPLIDTTIERKGFDTLCIRQTD